MVEYLNALRFVEKYRGLNLYIVLVFDDDGQPYEVMASVSSAEINPDQLTLSNLDALCAMTSLAMREFEIPYVCAKLLQTARTPNTLPAIIADILINHAGPNIFKPGEDKDHVQEIIVDADRVGKCQGEECQGRTAQEICG